MNKITEKDIRKYRKNALQRKIYQKINIWVLLILYSIVGSAVLILLLFSSSEKIVHIVEGLGGWIVVIYLVLGIAIVFLHLKLGTILSNKDKKYCEELGKRNYNADELMTLAKQYDLKEMYSVALSKRMQELNVSNVPEWFVRDMWGVRLPERKDYK